MASTALDSRAMISELVKPESFSLRPLMIWVKSTLFGTDPLCFNCLRICIVISYEDFDHLRLFEVWKVLEIDATMFLDVMRNCLPKFDMLTALCTRFRTCRRVTYTLLDSFLIASFSSKSFVNCSLTVSFIFLLAVKAFLTCIAPEVTQARFK